jgi:hypothetical protein
MADLFVKLLLTFATVFAGALVVCILLVVVLPILFRRNEG